MNPNKKIFCISFQRTGTTSVGLFFKHFGYQVAPWEISNRNLWGQKWYLGDFKSIFQSDDFINHEVFEDGPWYFPEFYKYLFNEIPGTKFILFKRNPDKWFDSMLSHSTGMNPGNSFIHSKVYRRENEFRELFAKSYSGLDFEKARNLLPLKDRKDHYIKIYNVHNIEVEEYFMSHSPKSLVICELEDMEKWQKLGDFFGLRVPKDFDIHANKTVR